MISSPHGNRHSCYVPAIPWKAVGFERRCHDHLAPRSDRCPGSNLNPRCATMRIKAMLLAIFSIGMPLVIAAQAGLEVTASDWLGQADCWPGGQRPSGTNLLGRLRAAHETRESVAIAEWAQNSRIPRRATSPEVRFVHGAGNQPLWARIGFRSGLRAAYVAGHPPRFGTRRRPRRWATTLSRCRLAAKKRPNRRPLLRFSSRACQVSAVVPIKDVRPGHRDARGAV